MMICKETNRVKKSINSIQFLYLSFQLLIAGVSIFQQKSKKVIKEKVRAITKK